MYEEYFQCCIGDGERSRGGERQVRTDWNQKKWETNICTSEGELVQVHVRRGGASFYISPSQEDEDMYPCARLSQVMGLLCWMSKAEAGMPTRGKQVLHVTTIWSLSHRPMPTTSYFPTAPFVSLRLQANRHSKAAGSFQ